MKYSFFLVDNKGDIHGKSNYDRFNKLPWYKKLWGKLFYSYKRKFIDIEGFGTIKNVDTSDFRDGDTLYLSTDTLGAWTTKKPKLS